MTKSLDASGLEEKKKKKQNRLTIVATPKTLTDLNRRVGLGIGLGVRPLLLTSICSEGEKHCCLRGRGKKHTHTHKKNMVMRSPEVC